MLVCCIDRPLGAPGRGTALGDRIIAPLIPWGQRMTVMQIGDVEINVRQWGSGDTVFLVHGLGTNSGLWINQIPVLSPHYHVVAIDLRGFGRSGKPQARDAYSIEQMADDVIGVCKALDISSIHYLGVSMGGFIGQTVALKAPDLCRSLILGHTACEFGIPAEILEVRMAALDSTSMDEYAKLVAAQALAQPPEPILEEWLCEMIADNDLTAYKHVLAGARAEFDVSDRVGSIQQPTLIIAGSDDRVIPPEKGASLNERMPNSSYVLVDGVGHIGYAEKPAIFNQHVTTFLAQQ